MPFFDFKIFEKINFGEEKIILPQVNGKFQPLAAFYHKSVAEIFLKEISLGQRKMITAIKKVQYKILEIGDEKIFFNVNTREDLKLSRGRAENLSRKIPIISIVATESNTCKTTFIEKIIKNLNLRVGVVKSTHHKIS